MAALRNNFSCGSREKAISGGFKFLGIDTGSFVIETVESLRAISCVEVGGVCNFCSRVYEEPLPVEYQGKRGMVLRKFFPGMLTIATGGDYHLYIQGKAICWQPTDTGFEEYRLLELDRIFKFTEPIGRSTGNVDDDIACSVVLRTSYMARLKVPDFAVDVSGFSTGVATYDICFGPESVLMWEPWRECWLEEHQIDDDYEFDDDYLYDFGRQVGSYEYVGCDFLAAEFNDNNHIKSEFDEDIDVVCSEEIVRFGTASGFLDTVAEFDTKTDVGSISCSVGVTLSSCDDGKFVKSRPDVLDVRDVSMAGLFSSKGGSAIVWSGIDLITDRFKFELDELVLSHYGNVPSAEMVNKFKLPSGNLDKLRLCMLERCGAVCIEYLYSLYLLRAGYSASVYDGLIKTLSSNLKLAWEGNSLRLGYDNVVGSSRLLNLIVAVLACDSLKCASLFLQSIYPISVNFSKLVIVNNVVKLHDLVSLVEQNGEFCKKLSFVGDKLLRLLVNLSYLVQGKCGKRFYFEIDNMLTKKNIGKPLVVGSNLGLTLASADNCRARFFLSVLCCPRSICSIGNELGLFDKSVWHALGLT